VKAIVPITKKKQDSDLPYHKPPRGKIVAQVRYASRLTGFVAGQDYLGRHFTTVLRLISAKNDFAKIGRRLLPSFRYSPLWGEASGAD
jgi:hypothetical protein